MMADTSDTSAETKFEKASQQVEKEIQQGKPPNGTGLFAMKKASNYVPAEYDAEGKRTKDGYIADADSDRPGYYFLAADAMVTGDKPASFESIQNTFFLPKLSNAGGDVVYNNLYLQERLSSNLNSDSSILSSDQKRDLIYSAQRGKYDDKTIPDNIKMIIVQAKANDSSLTTKDVMDMVMNGITEGKEFKSYTDVRWSSNHEDLTKKLAGTCTDNAQKNFALCLTQRAKALNLDINKEIIEILRRSR